MASLPEPALSTAVLDGLPGAIEPTLAEAGELPMAPSAAPTARYLDRGLLARGGMGELRLLYDQHLERMIVQKSLLGSLAHHAAARLRFETESRITAGLQHPAIVGILDCGAHPDGRPWYTMRALAGAQTLRVQFEARAVDRALWALEVVAGAMAHAHARGVIHRDVKPENLLLGDFDEVLVIDWGIARRAGVGDAGALPVSGAGTRVGALLGTPPYLPPEQALGRVDEHGPGSDVWALGVMLAELLGSVQPFPRAVPAFLQALAQGLRPPRLPDAPAPLVALVQACLKTSPTDRPTAQQVADILGDWRRSARLREQAGRLVNEAEALVGPWRGAQAAAQACAQRAVELLAALPPHAPAEDKAAGWALEGETADHRAQALGLEVRLEQQLRAALALDSAQERAHRRLADLFAARLIEAEAARDAAAQVRAQTELSVHDRGDWAALLKGLGRHRLRLDRPAHLQLLRSRPGLGRLVWEPVEARGLDLGFDLELPAGSYLALLTPEEGETVRLPLCIARGVEGDDLRPGDREPRALRLPRPGELSAAEALVPAGWAWFGGDPEAADALPRHRRWVDSFVMARRPVTVGEWARFLDGEAVAEGVEAALRLAPRQTAGGAMDHPLLVPGAGGRFVPVADPDGVVWELDWPVTLVDNAACEAFLAALVGDWRLPHSLEWEKAARGVDGRFFPWGDRFEATWVSCALSQAGPPRRVSVEATPEDCSVYGIVQMAGNVRNRCLDVYQRGPWPGETVEVSPRPIGADALQVSKGGAWLASPPLCRPAGRFADRPDRRISSLGFRLARSW